MGLATGASEGDWPVLHAGDELVITTAHAISEGDEPPQVTSVVHVPLDAEVINGRAAASSALTLLSQAMLYIDDARQRAVAAGDVDGLMLGLEFVHKIAEQLKVVTDAIKADIAASGIKGWHPVGEGEGWVGVAPTHKDTWDPESLIRDLVSTAVGRYLEEAGGEVPNVFALIPPVVQAIFACAPLTPSNAWRSTKLAEYGIAADDYRARTSTERVTWAAEPPVQMRTRLLREKGAGDGA